MKKIIAGVCTNLLITNLAIAENRIESIDITKEYEVPFSDIIWEQVSLKMKKS